MQCGSMEAKAPSFVLRTVGSEHHRKSTRRAFKYVVGGLVGINDTCHFSFDMKNLGHTHPSIGVESTMCARATES